LLKIRFAWSEPVIAYAYVLERSPGTMTHGTSCVLDQAHTVYLSKEL